jgi:hypothetical protein
MGSGEITFFAILSFVFSSFAYVPYIRGVLASTTKPTLSTWISWGLMDLAILVDYSIHRAFRHSRCSHMMVTWI